MKKGSSDKIIIDNQELTIDRIMSTISSPNAPGWEKKIYQFILDWFTTKDSIFQQTSGTTGKPKVIQLKKSAMVASAKATISALNLQSGDTAWLCLPIDYIAGKMMVVRSIIGEFNLLITEPSGLPPIPDQKISFASMIPMQVKKLIEDNADFSTICKLIIGGTSVDYSLLMALQKIPTQVFATYGMTETCSHIALQKINGSNPDSYFKTLKGITVGLNDTNCLTVFAPNLSNTPIQTTDLADIISPSEFKWLGRADTIINSGGIKISPEEIETLITPFVGSELIISSKKDKILGSRAVLVIEGTASDFDEELLIQQIVDITGKHKAPKEILFISKFPRNSSMKIDRKQVELLISQTNRYLENDQLE